MNATIPTTSLGSVSSGTMRPEDLIPAFVDVLDDLKEALSLSVTTTTSAEDTEAIKVRVGAIDDFLGHVESLSSGDGYWETDDNPGAYHYDLEQLFEELDAFAPAYCYFGAHPGDGADYGFWVHEDLVDDAKYDDEILLCEDLADIPADHTGDVLQVNDHGNRTLYACENGELSEVWAVV